MKDKPAGIKLDAFLGVFDAEIGMVNYRGASTGLPKLELMEGLQSRIVEAWRDLIEGAHFSARLIQGTTFWTCPSPK